MRTLICLSIISIFTLFSCKNDCEQSEFATCQEQVPTDEICQAQFERWFYDSSKNNCEFISYTGCNQYGFVTKEDCEICRC